MIVINMQVHLKKAIISSHSAELKNGAARRKSILNLGLQQQESRISVKETQDIDSLLACIKEVVCSTAIKSVAEEVYKDGLPADQTATFDIESSCHKYFSAVFKPV